MEITEFSQKVDVIARYRAAMHKLPPTLLSDTGRPMNVGIQFTGRNYAFTLDGSEMEKLLSKFGVSSVQRLFSH